MRLRAVEHVSGLRPPRRNVTDERELRGHVARVLRVAIGVDRGLTAATSCRRCPSTRAARSNPKFRDQDQGLTQKLARALGPQARTASRTEPLPRSHPTTAQNAGPERRRLEPDTLGYRRARDSRQVFGVHTDRPLWSGAGEPSVGDSRRGGRVHIDRSRIRRGTDLDGHHGHVRRDRVERAARCEHTDYGAPTAAVEHRQIAGSVVAGGALAP